MPRWDPRTIAALASLAAPILVSGILYPLTAVINLFWVGHFLGVTSLAAVSISNQVLPLLLSLMTGIASLSGVMVAQSVGAGDRRRTNHVISAAATFYLGLTFMVALSGFILAPEILKAFGTPPEACRDALIFLRIAFAAVPSVCMLQFWIIVVRATGDSRTGATYMVAGLVSDVVLNPLLLYDWNGRGGLGVAGAALSMLIAHSLALGMIITRLQRSGFSAHFDVSALRPSVIPRQMAGNLSIRGPLLGAQGLIYAVSGAGITAAANQHGISTSAALGTVVQIWQLVQFPAVAIASAAAILAAQSVGAGNWMSVRTIVGSALWLWALLGYVLLVILYCGSPYVLRWFLGQTQDALPLASKINSIIPWSHLFIGFTVILLAACRSTGAVAVPLGILAISLLGVRLGLATLGQRYIGADMIWWSLPAGSLMALIMSALYYMSGRWQRARLFPARPNSTGCPETS